MERGLGKNLSSERFAPVVGINFCTSTGFMGSFLHIISVFERLKERYLIGVFENSSYGETECET